MRGANTYAVAEISKVLCKHRRFCQSKFATAYAHTVEGPWKNILLITHSLG